MDPQNKSSHISVTGSSHASCPKRRWVIIPLVNQLLISTATTSSNTMVWQYDLDEFPIEQTGIIANVVNNDNNSPWLLTQRIKLKNATQAEKEQFYALTSFDSLSISKHWVQNSNTQKATTSPQITAVDKNGSNARQININISFSSSSRAPKQTVSLRKTQQSQEKEISRVMTFDTMSQTELCQMLLEIVPLLRHNYGLWLKRLSFMIVDEQAAKSSAAPHPVLIVQHFSVLRYWNTYYGNNSMSNKDEFVATVLTLPFKWTQIPFFVISPDTLIDLAHTAVTTLSQNLRSIVTTEAQLSPKKTSSGKSIKFTRVPEWNRLLEMMGWCEYHHIVETFEKQSLQRVHLYSNSADALGFFWGLDRTLPFKHMLKNHIVKRSSLIHVGSQQQSGNLGDQTILDDRVYSTELPSVVGAQGDVKPWLQEFELPAAGGVLLSDAPLIISQVLEHARKTMFPKNGDYFGCWVDISQFGLPAFQHFGCIVIRKSILGSVLAKGQPFESLVFPQHALDHDHATWDNLKIGIYNGLDYATWQDYEVILITGNPNFETVYSVKIELTPL
jgi:hypothetical protein